MMKIPVLLFTLKTTDHLGKRFRGLGKSLLKLQPKLGNTLKKIGFAAEPEAYAVASLFSALIYGLLLFTISLVALNYRGHEQPVQLALAIGLLFWIVFFGLHLIYPAIIMKKIAAKESKDMLFALREIMMNVNSGVPLFDAMKNVAQANYGYISKDFEWVVIKIERGIPQREALKALAVKTESEFLKRAVWQMVNAMETGASMGTALPGIVENLENYIYRDIRNYSSNLNFMLLIYMLVAAVVPSLGITFLVLLSAFSELGVDIVTVMLLVGGSALMQMAMIGFMSSSRPEIFGG
jgi:flagellar protein FlaJ